MNRSIWKWLAASLTLLLALGIMVWAGLAAYLHHRNATWLEEAEAAYAAGDWTLAKHRLERYLPQDRTNTELLLKYANACRHITANRTASLQSASVAYLQILSQDPGELDDTRLADAAPDGLGYADLPAFLATADGAKALERALRDRLDDRLQAELIYDPVTKRFSNLGEDENAFAARLTATPGVSAKRTALETKIAKLQRDIATKEQEVKGRKWEKWLSVFTVVFRNLASLSGGKGKVSTTGMGGVLTKNRMENTAEQRKASLEAQLQEAQQQLAEVSTPDPSRFERRVIKPAKTDVSLIRYDVVWVY